VKRWSKTKGSMVRNPKIDAFIEDLIAVCDKHGLSISHEDTHGAFTVEVFSEKRIDWLRNAHEDL